MFLPISKADMMRRGWDAPDFLLVSGDAYVDHPSFGHAVISRALEAAGFRVAILPQPDWTDARSFLRLGTPKLGVLVTSGVVDSMVNHYTAAKKRRSNDSYSPGGAAGKRPDRAVITYCNRLRSALKGSPLIIGGVEAGLRAFAHYDYWDDYVRRSILIDSGADILVYGMGEKAIVEIAGRLAGGEPVGMIRDVRGTAYVDTPRGLEVRRDGAAGGVRPDGGRLKYIELPSYEDVSRAKKTYAEAFAAEYGEQDPIRGNVLYQRHGAAVVVKNPPSPPMTQGELDRVYELPYERKWHPSYDAAGGVPALEEVKFSVVSHRGCFGECSFCAIGMHQGRIVQKRSAASILNEVAALTRDPDFKGYIHDVGGPSANMRNPACAKQLEKGACKNKRCLSPKPCANLVADHREYLELLRAAGRVPGVKKAFVRSGVRYDYIMLDSRGGKFIRELCENHVSGQLKVAPEHVSKNVLAKMGKPAISIYDAFRAEFMKANASLGLKQYIVPYLMSGHPGSLLSDAIELAVYLRNNNIYPEQVQDFYPTPGTMSTCMYYTGVDPLTMTRAHVPGGEEKLMQRALLQCRRPENRGLVIKALKLAGRTELIGYGKGCLVPPERDDRKWANVAKTGTRRNGGGETPERDDRKRASAAKAGTKRNGGGVAPERDDRKRASAAKTGVRRNGGGAAPERDDRKRASAAKTGVRRNGGGVPAADDNRRKHETGNRNHNGRPRGDRR